MRDQFKILSEKYTLIQEKPVNPETLASWVVDKYPNDKDKFMWWLINFKTPEWFSGHHGLAPKTVTTLDVGYMIRDMMDDLYQEIDSDRGLDQDERFAQRETVFEDIQEALHGEYVHYFLINQNNPGIPSNF